MKITQSPFEDNNDSRHASDGETSHQLSEQKNDVAELTATSVEGNRVDENQPASTEEHKRPTENVTPEKRDIFDDLASLGRPLDEIVPSQKVLTSLPVRKPKKDEWVRLHPEIHTNAYIYEVFEERGCYVVLPSVVEPMLDLVRYVQLSLAVNYKGNPFVWPVQIPTERNPHAASISAFAGADRATREWIRISWGGKEYEVYRRRSAAAEPEWPTEISNASEMLRFASKAGAFEIIDSLDHPVVRRLLGND